ncbi:MAG TPA: FAD-binding protein [Gammaproteobacteria bacterium]|nr:FAD-binding protein [Gammaproteobacteria bacterium]
MKILMIIEHDNKILKSANFHTLEALQSLEGKIDILIAGYQCDAIVEQAKKLLTIQKIRVADAHEYQYQLAENLAPLIAEISKEYEMIAMAATTFGKNILPRVAALRDVSMVSDVTQIISADTFIRPIYAGNALLTVKSHDKIKMLTVRMTAFSPMKSGDNENVIVEKITQIIPNTLSEFVGQQLTVSERPELTDARIVISGGRGLKSAENFKKLEAFADSIGAAVGASRAAVDAGFAPNDYQVGQTGKVVAPELYIAVGISGAIQHLAGMKDSKVIVAINTDPDAPIFQIADYGLVGDILTLLPELQKELSECV